MSDIGVFEAIRSARSLRRLKFGPLRRRPLDEVAYADHWSTPWPAASIDPISGG
ncbi:MAG TPA: hypothetical protein VE993_12120 [Stellaceae bacterium]|nr:hypothetical protein [Stellaceae bacterium]